MEQQQKIQQLKAHLEGFLLQLDNLDPSKASVEDIDQLIKIIESMEEDLQ
ncbi:SE1561 family protein [Aquibacillus koreensis]|uniref:SE1561 family protein n=1 Tax=Aquibacillus koreensis TaxID=279446 RepID=A0A9X3WQF9_9BACI|nr:SE1561 family protein [Aquibacillus koreensis]MCT2534419.1 SE1561 family protein [Aquibacillus koreensis]MDC3421726.1 SE1561 family protein [Aquibacillus koreensis]